MFLELYIFSASQKFHFDSHENMRMPYAMNGIALWDEYY